MFWGTRAQAQNSWLWGQKKGLKLYLTTGTMIHHSRKHAFWKMKLASLLEPHAWIEGILEGFSTWENCLWFLPPKDIWSREEMRWWTTFTCQKAMPCNAMLWELVCILSHYFYILKVYWAAVIFLYCCSSPVILMVHVVLMRLNRGSIYLHYLAR